MKYLVPIGMLFSLFAFGLCIYDNNLKDKKVTSLLSKIKDTKESSYESGCNNGSYQSCQLLQDMKDRYEECLKSALINCKTWSMLYRDEQNPQLVTKKEKKETKK
jgi:hypothetical protein